MPLLTDIQTSLLANEELAPILLKLRFLAARLGSDAMEEWVRFEAEGYPSDAEVPAYRVFPLSYTGSFNGPFGRMASGLPIPTAVVAAHGGEKWLSHPERQSVGTLEALLSASASTGTNFQIDASNLILLLGTKVFTGMACHDVDGWISRGSVVGMLNALRGRVLDLAINLENNIPGVMDVDVARLSNNNNIKDYAAVTNNITHNTVYGNQNTTSIANSGSGASISVNVHQGDVAELRKALEAVGLQPAAASELSELVVSEKPTGSGEPLGAKAKAWLGSNLVKVSGKLGVAVAAQLITKAVAGYYGLN